jgi:hypothetical protein
MLYYSRGFLVQTKKVSVRGDRDRGPSRGRRRAGFFIFL